MANVRILLSHFTTKKKTVRPLQVHEHCLPPTHINTHSPREGATFILVNIVSDTYFLIFLDSKMFMTQYFCNNCLLNFCGAPLLQRTTLKRPFCNFRIKYDASNCNTKQKHANLSSNLRHLNNQPTFQKGSPKRGLRHSFPHPILRVILRFDRIAQLPRVGYVDRMMLVDRIVSIKLQNDPVCCI